MKSVVRREKNKFIEYTSKPTWNDFGILCWFWIIYRYSRLSVWIICRWVEGMRGSHKSGWLCSPGMVVVVVVAGWREEVSSWHSQNMWGVCGGRRGIGPLVCEAAEGGLIGWRKQLLGKRRKCSSGKECWTPQERWVCSGASGRKDGGWESCSSLSRRKPLSPLQRIFSDPKI